MALNFSVVHSESFDEDMQNIYKYISDTLNNPEAASSILHSIILASDSLAVFPKRYRVRRKDKYGQDIRYMPVGKRSRYIVIYSVDESKNVVYVSRVLHETKNIDALI